MSIRRAWTTDGDAGRCASALTRALREVKGTSIICQNWNCRGHGCKTVKLRCSNFHNVLAVMM